MNRYTATHHIVEPNNFNFLGINTRYRVPAPNYP
jgi:hypothetical protein